MFVYIACDGFIELNKQIKVKHSNNIFVCLFEYPIIIHKNHLTDFHQISIGNILIWLSGSTFIGKNLNFRPRAYKASIKKQEGKKSYN